MIGYSACGRQESYYAEYVSYLFNLEQDERETKFQGFDFEKVFPNGFKAQFDQLQNEVKALFPEGATFPSVIDTDYSSLFIDLSSKTIK